MSMEQKVVEYIMLLIPMSVIEGVNLYSSHDNRQIESANPYLGFHIKLCNTVITAE